MVENDDDDDEAEGRWDRLHHWPHLQKAGILTAW